MADYIFADGVEEELVSIWEYIAKQNPDAATRVVESVHETCESLAANPGLGKLCAIHKSRWKDLRFFRVAHFKDYLILYRPVPRGVEVIHVTRRSRNIIRLLSK